MIMFLLKDREKLTRALSFSSGKTPSLQFLLKNKCSIALVVEQEEIFYIYYAKEGLTFPEAVEKLAARAGVTVNRNEISPLQQKKLEKRDRLYRINEEAARFFRRIYFLRTTGKQALEYLKKRSFDLETIEKFQLGLAPSQWDGLIKFFEKRGVKVQELVELGLALPNKQGTGYYDRFRNRIMFPIWDNVGRVIAFGGRVMDDSLPKS